MPDVKKLRAEHVSLSAIAQRLSAMIARKVPPPSQELYQLRMELFSGLIRHLNSEEWILYPALIRSGDEHAALTAQAFSASMGGLANEFKTYFGRWDADAITSNWRAYQSETFEILRALTLRITREERDLYPLLDVTMQAAAQEFIIPAVAPDPRSTICLLIAF